MKQTTAVKANEPTGPLTDAELHQLNAYWRAANYLSVGPARQSLAQGAA